MGSDTSALQLVLTGDPALLAIVRLSLIVSLSAVALAALIAVPFGAFVALNRFPGREAVIVLMNALMGLPPVVAGLAVYLLVSRSGPLGALGLLFTPTAMIIAQAILVTPIIAALTRQTIGHWADTPALLGSAKLRHPSTKTLHIAPAFATPCESETVHDDACQPQGCGAKKIHSFALGHD
jgi:ABC-type tungstate transport system substrate-binding protein